MPRAGFCIIMLRKGQRCVVCGRRATYDCPDAYSPTKPAPGGSVQPKVIDVEQIKKQVRKMAAGRVLAGQAAEVGLDLAH